jgi:hypothetical protein
MKKSKYTLKGDAAFDKMLDRHLDDISDAIKKSDVSKDIAAIVLGGGYGRGEGGVFKTSDGQKKLYNDLDFFVIAENLSRSRLKKIDKALAVIGESFSREIGIDVDFGPAKTLKQLGHMPFTMMWQELREGHVLVYGTNDVLNSLPDYDLHDLPRSEGLRLLLNRGAGLLFARQRFRLENISTADCDFIGRNLYKTVLACGDVFLLLQNQYCLSVQNRLCLLEELGAEDVKLYRQAVQFKLSPQIYSIQELLALQKLVMIMFEKACLHFFSVCYNFAINNLQELKSAFKDKCYFLQNVGIKDLAKNYIKNLLYVRKVDDDFGFSSTSPRLRLLQLLLVLLFENHPHYGYTMSIKEKNFLECWDKLN